MCSKTSKTMSSRTSKTSNSIHAPPVGLIIGRQESSMTYVFNYGRKDAGYEVPVGTEFIARSLRLRNGRPEVVEERLRVFGDEYGFGSAESFEEVIPAGRAMGR